MIVPSTRTTALTAAAVCAAVGDATPERLEPRGVGLDGLPLREREGDAEAGHRR